MSRAASRRDDVGSAAAEFTLVAALVTIIVAGVLQLALALHVRNTLVSAAAEGARIAGLADRTLGDGVARAEWVIDASLGGYDADVTASVIEVDGAAVVEVEIVAPFPTLGLWGLGVMRVDGHAFVEASRD